MDLMSVPCHVPDVYHEQYKTDHRDEDAVKSLFIQSWIGGTFKGHGAAVAVGYTLRPKGREKTHYVQTD